MHLPHFLTRLLNASAMKLLDILTALSAKAGRHHRIQLRGTPVQKAAASLAKKSVILTLLPPVLRGISKVGTAAEEGLKGPWGSGVHAIMGEDSDGSWGGGRRVLSAGANVCWSEQSSCPACPSPSGIWAQKMPGTRGCFHPMRTKNQQPVWHLYNSLHLHHTHRERRCSRATEAGQESRILPHVATKMPLCTSPARTKRPHPQPSFCSPHPAPRALPTPPRELHRRASSQVQRGSLPQTPHTGLTHCREGATGGQGSGSNVPSPRHMQRTSAKAFSPAITSAGRPSRCPPPWASWLAAPRSPQGLSGHS